MIPAEAWFTTKKLARHAWRAQHRHGIHSPFVYAFQDGYNTQLAATAPNLKRLAQVVSKIKTDTTSIAREEVGTGNPGIYADTPRAMFRRSSSSAEKGRLLTRWVHYTVPQTILELGTHLGVGTLYLWAGNPQAKITTVEGCRETLDYARQRVHSLAPEINLQHALFDDFLNDYKTPTDLVYLDGNHSYAATVRYLEKLLPHLNAGSSVVVDDILWSRDMHRAWRELVSWPLFTVALNFGRLGILVSRPNQARQEFFLKPNFFSVGI